MPQQSVLLLFLEHFAANEPELPKVTRTCPRPRRWSGVSKIINYKKLPYNYNGA